MVIAATIHNIELLLPEGTDDDCSFSSTIPVEDNISSSEKKEPKHVRFSTSDLWMPLAKSLRWKVEIEQFIPIYESLNNPTVVLADCNYPRFNAHISNDGCASAISLEWKNGPYDTLPTTGMLDARL